MEQYISKSALVAEIENLVNTYKKCPTRNSYEEGLKDGRLIGYEDALHKINTLEMKEVDEIPARIEVNKYHNRFISSWAGLCQYDNYRIGEEIKILLPKNKAQKGEEV